MQGFLDAPKQLNTRDDNNEIKTGKRPKHFDSNQSVGCQKDTDAHWVSNYTEVHYGYKNHVKVNAKRMLIIIYVTTDGHESSGIKKTSLTTVTTNCMQIAFINQKSYLLKECDCCNFIEFEAARNRPLTQ